MIGRASWTACLGCLAAAAAYAVFAGGGDAPFAFSLTLFLLGLAGIVGGLVAFKGAAVTGSDEYINAAALLFPAYAAFQLVPLPVALLRIISPTRAEIAGALAGVMHASVFAPMSVAPPTTWVHLFRIAAYAIVFFVVRQLVRRSPAGQWTTALPIVAIAAAEAGWALLGNSVINGTGTGGLSGTYPNRNHFAGLLEMALPFSLMYGLALLGRRERHGLLSAGAVVQAALLLALACLMLVAILLSTSKSGVIACLLSLFFMTALSFGGRLPARRRWVFFAGLAVLFLVVFVFLTPSELVERFGSVTSDQPTEGRLPIWRDTMHVIAAYPVFGCGLGAFFPTFLRYQFAGVGFAWTNTHNDYLQLLSELGAVGFLAPALLMSALFKRAVRASSDASDRDTRFVGLACGGSLLALLVHSVTDFNTYVTANGLVLAWIAGIAGALPARTAFAPTKVRRARSIIGPAALVLGVAVAAYSGAWLVFLQRFQTDVAAERAFCRIGVCDTEGALTVLQAQLNVSAREDLPPDVLLNYLERDSAAPYRWDDVGYALNKVGRRDAARRSFARAVQLGPTSASTLLMAADFQFDDRQDAAAFDLVSRALATGDEQSQEGAFALLEAKRIPASRVLESVSMTRRASLSFFRRLTSGDGLNLEAARVVWPWLVQHGYVNDRLAADYTGILLGNKHTEAAWQEWLVYARGRSAGYPDSNRIFNGDFEQDSAGGPFDWEMKAPAGVAIDFDQEQHYSGARALRLRFDGSTNVGEVGVAEETFLGPGRYIFQAHVRTDGVTTDQGIRFRLTSNAPSGRLDVVTDGVRGTSDWTIVEQAVDVGAEGVLVKVSVVRQPSLKFDNLVRGTGWIDRVSLARSSPESPPTR